MSEASTAKDGALPFDFANGFFLPTQNPTLGISLKLLVTQSILAFLIDAGAQADADVALVDGKCVPHGSVFQEMISAIKAKKTSDKAAWFIHWLIILNCAIS